MNMDQLQAFVYIVQHGTFTKASELLYVPQPTLSIRIQLLEKELGVRLFDRQKKAITLTAAGIEFYKFAMNMLKALEDTKAAMRELASDRVTTLRFGIPFSYGIIVAGLVPYIARQVPKVRFSFHQAISETVIEGLKNRSLDIGITYIETYDKQLVFERIDRQPIRLIVPPGHPLAGLSEVDLERVAGEALILVKSNTPLRNLIEAGFSKARLKYNVYIETDNVQIIKELVKNNQGVSLMPERLVHGELAEGSLRAVPIRRSPFRSWKAYLSYCTDNDHRMDTLLYVTGLIKEFFSDAKNPGEPSGTVGLTS